MSSPASTLFALALFACHSQETKPTIPETTPTTPRDTDAPTTPIDTPSDTGTPTDSGPTTAALDCAAVPAGPRPAVALRGGLYASEDFAFDAEGHLISATGADLVKQDYPPGDIVPFAPTGTDPSSMRMLPTGDLVYANIDTSSLFRVRLSDGATELVAGGFGYATGIDVHPSGMVFMGDSGRVKRIDPYLGTVEIVFDNSGLFFGTINGLTFSEDFGTLYMGTRDLVYSIPVDADGIPSGPPALVWEAGPGELLGMGFDACGNLYALHDGRLLRFADVASWPGGEPEVLTEGGLNTTNLQWGSGLGGWDDRKIYVTDRSLQRPPFYEVDVGVPSKHYW